MTTFSPGGEGTPAPDGRSAPAPSGAGWIPCALCLLPIHLDQYRTARCWTDPEGVTVAAHAACLLWVGETELRLPPDPGEPTTTTHLF
jgi:hypothetical protein